MKRHQTWVYWLAVSVAWLAVLVLFLALVAALAFAQAPASCHLYGTGPFTAPSNDCTPGGFVRKTWVDVCDGRTDRPTLPARERRAILANYGVPGWTGANGELDHRVPLVLGGVTSRANVWPEAGRIPNPKDRLEAVILRRVCFREPHPMRVSTAVRVFLADWRAAFAYYVLGVGPRPPASTLNETVDQSGAGSAG